MPILYTVITRGNTVLAKHADCVGNFSEVTEKVIKNIDSANNHMTTYTHGTYRFHYICQDKLIYMCIADDEFVRARAFKFLEKIKKIFLETYGLTVATALPYTMNTEFSRVITSELTKCNDSKEYDSISRVHGQMDELKDIMVKNIENVTARGERLELLYSQTENLRNNTVTFRQASRNLARAMFWRNVRMYFLLGLILLFVVYVVTSMFCGGLLWQTCLR